MTLDDLHSPAVIATTRMLDDDRKWVIRGCGTNGVGPLGDVGRRLLDSEFGEHQVLASLVDRHRERPRARPHELTLMLKSHHRVDVDEFVIEGDDVHPFGE